MHFLEFVLDEELKDIEKKTSRLFDKGDQSLFCH